jgi:hypothetical protein
VEDGNEVCAMGINNTKQIDWLTVEGLVFFELDPANAFALSLSNLP